MFSGMEELVSLVNIRNYAYSVINNSNFDRGVVNDLTAFLILLDKKIIDLMRSPEFKDYVGFSDAKKTIHEMVQQTSVKSGLQK
jgi:hypothetical protein